MPSPPSTPQTPIPPIQKADDNDDGEDEDSEGLEEVAWEPEFRLVKRDDPEAYSFATPQYSAHKMPKDVVDAAGGEADGEAGLREFMGRWREIVRGQERERAGEEDGEDGV